MHFAKSGENSGIPRATQCQEKLLPLSTKDAFDAKRVPWVTGCFSRGLVHLAGSAVGLRSFLQLCLVPPLSAKTGSAGEKWGPVEKVGSSLQCSSPSLSAPTQFTKMVLKVLFLCC